MPGVHLLPQRLALYGVWLMYPHFQSRPVTVVQGIERHIRTLRDRLKLPPYQGVKGDGIREYIVELEAQVAEAKRAMRDHKTEEVADGSR